MVTAAFIGVALLIGAVTAAALGGIRLGGWSAILLGICGLVYSVMIYPQYIVLVSFPLSVLFLLGGCISVVRRPVRTPASREASNGGK
jgi:hypothetical protein